MNDGLTLRERMVASLLLLAAEVLCGRCYKGGLPQEYRERIRAFRDQIAAAKGDRG